MMTLRALAITSRALLTIAIASIAWGVLAGTPVDSFRATAHPISGRVVDPAGKPVAAAQVALLRHGLDVGLLEEVTTDSEGRFSFQSEVKSKPDESVYKIVATATGFGAGFVDLIEWRDGADVRLNPEAIVRGVVKGPHGDPVVGLSIRTATIVFVLPAPEIEPDPDDRRPIPTSIIRFVVLPPKLALRWSAKTDANGRFSVSGLPKGGRIQFRHEDPRFAQFAYADAVHLDGNSKEFDAEFALKPGAAVRGRVIGADGKPVAGVRVNAQGSRDSGGWGTALTQEDGRFEIGSLPAGSYNIGLDLASEVAEDWTAVAFADQSLREGESRDDLEFRLISGVLVTGRVTDTSGRPVAGMHVGIYGPARPRSGAWVQSAKTGPDGKYVLRVPPGRQFVYLMGGPAGSPDDQQGREIEVADGKSAEVDFKNVAIIRI